MDAIATTGNIQADNTAKQFIVIKIDNEQYGIDIKYIDNIVRMQKITRVPKAQDYFIGVINLRGEIIPVMSMRKRMKLTEDEITDKTRIIILKPEQQATIGVLVDSVKEVVTLDEKDIEKTNVDISEKEEIYINSVGKKGENLISILSIHALINDKEQA